jgi:hypothetical protein
MNDELEKETRSLLSDLAKSAPDPESSEGVAVEYLKCLLAGSENHPAQVDFSDLKRFWLESVPWCSELSKRMEKLITMYDEVIDKGKNEQNGY